MSSIAYTTNAISFKNDILKPEDNLMAKNKDNLVIVVI